jgi:sugar phosphate isomerase/epimerase
MSVPLDPTDLVLCSGTLPRDISFEERVGAAVAGGFRRISLWARDYERAQVDGLSDSDIRALLADRGLEVAEIDPAWWWLPGASEVQIPDEFDSMQIFRYGEKEMFAIADAIGARSLNATDVFGGGWGVDDAAEAFATLCDRAGEHGLLVHLEGLPWSQIPDVRTAWEIVKRADRANGGITVDAWHFFRAGADYDALRAVPGPKVLGIQLDDGPAAPEANLVEATLHDRLLPGAGDFDLARLIEVLRDIDAVGPVGVEVFSDELHNRGAIAAAHAAGDATTRVLNAS